jgi:hypothetical protein
VRSLVAYLSGRGQTPMLATADNVASFFNGQDLTGWRSARGQWKVKAGEIIAPGPINKEIALLVNELVAGDFHLSLEVKLPKEGDGAILFRVEERPNEVPDHPAILFHAVKGGGIAFVRKKRNEFEAKFWAVGEETPPEIKPNAWNKLEIIAAGNRLKFRVNGKDDLTTADAKIPRRGLIALEGSIVPGQEIRFRNLQLKLLPGKEK